MQRQIRALAQRSAVQQGRIARERRLSANSETFPRSGGEKPYPFMCKKANDGSSVDIIEGWWSYYYLYLGEEDDAGERPIETGRVQVDFADFNLPVTESGDVLLKLNTAENTLVAMMATEIPAFEDNIYYKKIATVTFEDEVITSIEQHWKGGVLLTFLSAEESEGADEGEGGIEEEEEEDIPCDQNNGPGDGDDDGTEGPGDDDDDDDDGGGGGPGGGDDDTSGPGDADCYTTIPDSIP